MSVTDGDTIRVEIGGQTFAVRYIGVDTPETVAPGRAVGAAVVGRRVVGAAVGAASVGSG